MTQYNSLNVTLSDSQLNKLKSAIKNESEVVSTLSSNMIGNNETNQVFINLLQIIHQSILSCQKHNYQRWYNQEDFLVDYLVYY